MSHLETYPPLTDRLLEEVVRRILAAGSPQQVILFGSHARGDARPDSDLDLLIIEATDEPQPERAATYLRALADVYPAKDVVVRTPEEVRQWSAVRHAFVTTAVREGRILYVHNG